MAPNNPMKKWFSEQITEEDLLDTKQQFNNI